MGNILEEWWDYQKLRGRRLGDHILDFWVVWMLLFAMLFFSRVFGWKPWVKYAVYITAILFVLHLLSKPMATVYGLVGGSANIRTFLVNYLIIIFLFSGVYYYLFFKEAGVCFVGDNPVLDYSMFEGKGCICDTLIIRDNTYSIVQESRISDSTILCEQITRMEGVDSLYYHRVTYWLVLKNTTLTSLIQGPSDFFSQISDYGENMNTVTNDTERSSLFSIILLLHVLISWLFLGVFISLLYSKFRYEA